jgi:hypothetical protein
MSVLGGKAVVTSLHRAKARTSDSGARCRGQSGEDRDCALPSPGCSIPTTKRCEGQNVAIEYRWAEGQYDRMPQLAAELVRRRVAIIAMPGSPPAAVRAVKAANTVIPIVFSVGGDAVKFGLVASVARPEGNATGVNFFSAELVAKRLGLLRELLPGATRVAVLVNPADPERTEAILDDARRCSGDCAADPSPQS